MAADNITVSSEQFHTSLCSVLRQLDASGIANNFDSVTDALWSMDMWDFVINQANVIAALHTFSARDNMIIHKLTHKESA